MAKDPAFLFYTSDFLSGTMLMTDEQVGKYIRIMCYEHQNGRLSEEDMLKMCKSYDKDIYKHFKIDENGLYFNIKLEKESNRRIAYSESRSENRASKKGTHDKDMLNTCKSYVQHMETETETIDKKESEEREERLPYRTIVDYLNLKAGTSYMHTSQKTKDLIKARMNEKFTLESFYTVIDVKVAEWSGTDMQKYLRPETLFSNKFEGYLNQGGGKKAGPIKNAGGGFDL